MPEIRPYLVWRPYAVNATTWGKKIKLQHGAGWSELGKVERQGSLITIIMGCGCFGDLFHAVEYLLSGDDLEKSDIFWPLDRPHVQ